MDPPANFPAGSAFILNSSGRIQAPGINDIVEEAKFRGGLATIGCGINFTKKLLFFTKNGERIRNVYTVKI